LYFPFAWLAFSKIFLDYISSVLVGTFRIFVWPFSLRV
jgi:hypothetical protein